LLTRCGPRSVDRLEGELELPTIRIDYFVQADQTIVELGIDKQKTLVRPEQRKLKRQVKVRRIFGANICGVSPSHVTWRDWSGSIVIASGRQQRASKVSENSGSSP